MHVVVEMVKASSGGVGSDDVNVAALRMRRCEVLGNFVSAQFKDVGLLKEDMCLGFTDGCPHSYYVIGVQSLGKRKSTVSQEKGFFTSLSLLHSIYNIPLVGKVSPSPRHQSKTS